MVFRSDRSLFTRLGLGRLGGRFDLGRRFRSLGNLRKRLGQDARSHINQIEFGPIDIPSEHQVDGCRSGPKEAESKGCYQQRYDPLEATVEP